MVRIALANLGFPTTPDRSVSLALDAITEAAKAGAKILCFPEEFVPGYRLGPHTVAPPDQKFLQDAVTQISAATRDAKLTVILGTERIVEGGLRITSVVINPDGATQVGRIRCSSILPRTNFLRLVHSDRSSRPVT